jgi:acyl-CoA thioesterase
MTGRTSHRIPTLEDVSRLVGTDGCYTGSVDAAYCTPQGAFGGYLTTLALRAAVRTAEHARPIGVHCQFLAPARPGDIDVIVSTERVSSRAEALAVSIRQGDSTVTSSQVWVAGSGRHVDQTPAPPPAAPAPAAVRPLAQSLSGLDELPFVEVRPVLEPPLDRPRPEGDMPWPGVVFGNLLPDAPPSLRAWVRLRPSCASGEGDLDAGASVIALDWLIPMLATACHVGRMVLHSSLGLAIGFHESAAPSEWRFCEVELPAAREGIVQAVGRVWSDDGRLLATGQQQLLQRVRL